MSFKVYASPGFPEWMAAEDVSLAFTTYDTGKLFLVGRNSVGQLAVFERTFERAMGLAVTSSDALWLATSYQIWRFENCLASGQLEQENDRLYFPRCSFTTGDIDVHDIAIDDEGKAIFACTRFSCLAQLDQKHSFRSIWKPKFISRLAPEDRCHLNGLAIEDGVPRFVTTVAETDTPEGWRDDRACAGCVIDVLENEVICRGLSMPHSPRLWRGRLWLLNSGTGELGFIEGDTFNPITFVPGYGRGLSFVGNHAVVGVSRPRRNDIFDGLPLERTLEDRSMKPISGLVIIDIDRGVIAHRLYLAGIRELYDTAVLVGVTRPKLLGIQNDEIRQTVTDASFPRIVWRARHS